MRIAQFTFAWLIIASSLIADTPGDPVPLAFTSESSSNVIFTMTPAKYDKDYKVEKEAFGIAYKLGEDGKLKELYRTKGWYSSEVFISRDGRYLVRMGPWNQGSKPSKDDLAVAFYKDGKLIKQYSTEEMVKDKSKVDRSVSHYNWRGSTWKDDVPELDRMKLRLLLDYSYVFDLHTIDGWTYSFDVTTGKIKATVKTEEWLKR